MTLPFFLSGSCALPGAPQGTPLQAAAVVDGLGMQPIWLPVPSGSLLRAAIAA